MSAQAHDFSNPVRRESDIQRKMREFDAQKSKGVSYSPDTYDPATTKRDSNGTPFNAAATGPYAPPSPDRAGGRVPNRTNTHHTPEGSDNEEYKRNIHATGGNGRDKVESWVGNKLPRPRTHGNEDDEDRLKYADAIKVTTKDGDIVQEWNGKKDPKVRTHHNWSDSESQGEGRTSDNERPEPQVRNYKDERGNDVQEAKGDNTPIRAHHTWAPDSDAQAALDNNSGGIKTRKDRDGNDVQEADGDISIRTHGHDNDEERTSKKSSKKEKSHKHKKSSSGSGDIVTRTDRNGDIVQEAKGDIGLRVYGGDASKEDEKAEKARRKAAKKERKEREKTLSRSNTHQESYGEDHVRYENSDDDEDELETGYDSEGNEYQAGNQGGRIRAHAAGW